MGRYRFDVYLSGNSQFDCFLDERQPQNREVKTTILKTINAFGLDVFLLRMSRLSRKWPETQATGRYSEVFMEA